MRVALSVQEGSVSAIKTAPTPESFVEGIALLSTLVEALPGHEAATEAVVGIAGIFSEDKSGLVHAPHLSGWVVPALDEKFEKALGLPVLLENDTMLGALGEARFGAGANTSIVAYVAVGTGIGGARVVDGELDRNVRGFEIGHQYLGASGEAKELEELVSGSAIMKKHGKRASEIHDETFWDQRAKEFSYGLYNSLLHWSPSIVVLGGSLFKGIGMKKESIEAHLTEINRVLPSLPPLVYASLAEPGLIGASTYRRL